jgi:hypothetical protein
MADYKLTTGGVIYQGRTIPESEGNRDWVDYQSWLSQGNTPDPADQPSQEELDREAEVNQAPLTARQYFAAHPAAITFIRQTPEQ